MQVIDMPHDIAYFFLHESIGMMHLLSALLIISGILTANRVSKSTDPGRSQGQRTRKA